MALSQAKKIKLKKAYTVVVIMCVVKICIFLLPGLYHCLRKSTNKMENYEEIKERVGELEAAASVFLIWVHFLLLSFVLFWELCPLLSFLVPEFEVDKRRVRIWAIVHFLLGTLYVADCSLGFFVMRTDWEVVFHGVSLSYALEMIFITM